MSTGRWVRRAAVTGAGLWAARAALTRRATLADVAPELRHPLLWLPLVLRDERSLAVGRKATSRSPGPLAPGVTVTRGDVPGSAATVVVFDPEGRTRPSGVLVWAHGGGLVMGTAEAAGWRCSRIAAELGILVVSVEYRLAPEDPFPAGLDDCTAALRWVHETADDLGIDPTRVAVGGDSAGGGLAAAVSQRARDEGGPPIALQLLVYPMLDDRTALAEGPDTLIWARPSNRWAWTAYLGRAPSPTSTAPPYAAPARTEDLAGLPPTWLGVGSIDLFHAEGVAYAQRLAEAGVACELHVVEGMYHGADVFRPEAPIMRRFHASISSALRTAIG